MKRRKNTKPFTDKKYDFIRENCMSIPLKTLAGMLKCSVTKIKAAMKIKGIVVPEEIKQQFAIDSQLKKGHVPINKGMKQTDFMSKRAIARSAKTRFKPGRLPHNTKEQDGEITLRKDQRGIMYKWIRIKVGKWEMLHVYNWTKENGKVPDGSVIRFRDKDTMNCEVSNLMKVTRAEHATMNRWPNRFNGIVVAKKTDSKDVKKQRAETIKEVMTYKLREETERMVERLITERALEEQKRLVREHNLNVRRKEIRKRLIASLIRQDDAYQLRVQKNEGKRIAREAKTIAKAAIRKPHKKQKTKVVVTYMKERRQHDMGARFATITHDYSQMTAVRINHRTVIYAKPGEDPEKVRNTYLERLKPKQ